MVWILKVERRDPKKKKGKAKQTTATGDKVAARGQKKRVQRQKGPPPT